MLKELKNETNIKLTENGANTHETSNSYVLDYFAQGSALRNRSEKEIIKLFTKSLGEDKLLTMKILFNSRDIRGGQGERETFRKIIKYLANNHTDLIRKNMKLIPEFGRFDDLYALFDTPLENEVGELFKSQLELDLKSENPSILAKWLKSENASSKETRRLAKKTREMLGLTPKQYRKTLSTLRSKIDIVETKITKCDYGDIDYSKLPSRAGLIYRNAFLNHDLERYKEFLYSLEKGTSKINVGTLYPYDIVSKIIDNGFQDKVDETLEEMWKALPDYLDEDSTNAIVVADTSGSMFGTPIGVALSLALYFGERNKGEFANHFITFSRKPQLVEITGSNLHEKILNMSHADWGCNTNVEAVFDLILNTAIKYNMSDEDLPHKIIIISDMDFDWCGGSSVNETLFKTIGKKFKEAGYTIPRLTFWNVDSRQNNIPMINSNNVQLVSGCSPRLFEQVVKDTSAYELMLEVINNEIYDCITV